MTVVELPRPRRPAFWVRPVRILRGVVEGIGWLSLLTTVAALLLID